MKKIKISQPLLKLTNDIYEKYITKGIYPHDIYKALVKAYEMGKKKRA